MKNGKCYYGYLKVRKRKSLIRVLIGAAIMLAIFVTGLLIFHSRNNYCTLLTVVLALPVGKLAVDYMILVPHQSASQELKDTVEAEAGPLAHYYDCVFSNQKKPIGTQAVVVTDSCICAYTQEEKADKNLFETSVKEFIKNDKLNVNVTLYTDQKAFSKRVNSLSLNFDTESEGHQQRMQWNAESMLHMCL